MSVKSFNVGGRSYPFIHPDQMTMGEQMELSRISNGMTVLDIGEGLTRINPFAWNAVLLVSMRRVDPSVKDGALADINLSEAIVQQEDDDAVPPPKRTAGAK